MICAHSVRCEEVTVNRTEAGEVVSETIKLIGRGLDDVAVTVHNSRAKHAPSQFVQGERYCLTILPSLPPSAEPVVATANLAPAAEAPATPDAKPAKARTSRDK